MIEFKNCPVNVAGNELLASDVTISISNSAKSIKEHAKQGTPKNVPEGRTRGSISISYITTNSDTGIRDLTGINVFNTSVGPFNCRSGLLTSYSLNLDAYSVAKSQIEISFYGGYDQDGTTGYINETGGFIHGGISNVESDLLWNNDIINVNYSMSQNINPIYKLGEREPHGFSRPEGSITVGLNGTGLGKILSDPCSGFATGSINISGLCSDFSDSILFSGFVLNPDLNISSNQEIIGSLEVFNTF